MSLGDKNGEDLLPTRLRKIGRLGDFAPQTNSLTTYSIDLPLGFRADLIHMLLVFDGPTKEDQLIDRVSLTTHNKVGTYKDTPISRCNVTIRKSWIERALKKKAEKQVEWYTYPDGALSIDIKLPHEIVLNSIQGM